MEKNLTASNNLFIVWLSFFNENTSKTVGPMLRFNTFIVPFLMTSQNCISELSMSYFELNKSELPTILCHLKKTLTNLRIFQVSFSTGNEILDIISESDCQLQKLILNNIFQLDSKKILRFLKSQEKSLEKLDLTHWLNRNNPEEIDEIFTQISQMKNLKYFAVSDIDLINQDNTINTRLKLLNIKNLSLRISARRDIRNVTKIGNYKNRRKRDQTKCSFNFFTRKTLV